MGGLDHLGCHLGTAVHAGTALYDQSVLDGAGITPDEAAGAVADAIHKPGEDVDWSGADVSQAEAEGIAIALHKRYCAEIAPKQQYLAVEANCERLEITDQQGCQPGAEIRFIPTGVGNTSGPWRPWWSGPVHPHGCGEHRCQQRER